MATKYLDVYSGTHNNVAIEGLRKFRILEAGHDLRMSASDGAIKFHATGPQPTAVELILEDPGEAAVLQNNGAADLVINYYGEARAKRKVTIKQVVFGRFAGEIPAVHEPGLVGAEIIRGRQNVANTDTNALLIVDTTTTW